jgi:hypothetical protein
MTTLKAGALREVVYGRLRSHFQFTNEIALFAKKYHALGYEVLYQHLRALASKPTSFRSIWLIYLRPLTIDASYQHDGKGHYVGWHIKTKQWPMEYLCRHTDRIVES